MKLTAEEIAKDCHYDGERIFALMMDSLTDANFHELRNKLESTFADWLYEDQKRYWAECKRINEER